MASCPPFIVTLGILGITRGIGLPLVSVYSIAGPPAAVGGVLFASLLNAGIPTAGTGYELNADRRHSHNGGNLPAVNAFYLQIMIGALILIAVAFDQWQSRAK